MHNPKIRTKVLPLSFLIICLVILLCYVYYLNFVPPINALRMARGIEFELYAVKALQSKEYLNRLKSTNTVILDLQEIDSNIIVIKDKNKPDKIRVKADDTRIWWWYDQWDLRIDDYNTTSIKVLWGPKPWRLEIEKKL